MNIRKFSVVVCLLLLVVLLQYEYDAARPPQVATAAGAVSPEMVRAGDMGFHPAVASFLWVGTMPEALDLFRGRDEFEKDLSFVNAVDPKMGYPYAFSVITLPAIPSTTFPQVMSLAVAIGERGVRDADPDWRIPYYLATDYFLYLKDKASALHYYDIAARTPGVPQYAARFSLNFGIGTNERETTKQLWETIRDSTNDEFTKERAQAYIDRLNDFDYLEAAAKTYHQKFGTYPTSTAALIGRHIIPAIPADPFGFQFKINPDGTAGIDLTRLPSYLVSAPVQ